MAESTPEDKSVGRVNSFVKIFKSPLGTTSNYKSKRSKSALGKIFGSKKRQGIGFDDKSVSLHLKDVGLADEDFESMENTSISYDNKDDANTKTSTDEENKLGDLLQVAQEVVITNENLTNEIKEDMAIVNEKADKVVQAFEFTTINEKPLDVQQLPQPEVDVSSIVEQLEEVVISVPISIEQVPREVDDYLEKIEPSSMENEEVSNNDNEETIEEKSTEDNCVSSLAQGLGKICASWSTNKEN